MDYPRHCPNCGGLFKVRGLSRCNLGPLTDKADDFYFCLECNWFRGEPKLLHFADPQRYPKAPNIEQLCLFGA